MPAVQCCQPLRPLQRPPGRQLQSPKVGDRRSPWEKSISLPRYLPEGTVLKNLCADNKRRRPGLAASFGPRIDRFAWILPSFKAPKRPLEVLKPQDCFKLPSEQTTSCWFLFTCVVQKGSWQEAYRAMGAEVRISHNFNQLLRGRNLSELQSRIGQSSTRTECFNF